MKRIISCLMLITVLILGLSLTAFANDHDFTISEDYKTITLDGVTYVRTNTNGMSFWDTVIFDREPTLTENQRKELFTTEFYIDPQLDILDASLYFQDGSTLSACYLREDYLEEFLYWTTDDDVEYQVDFYWPNGNTVAVIPAQLKDSPVVLNSSAWAWGETYEINLEIENGTRLVNRGILVVENDRYYFVDYSEYPQLGCNGYFDLSEANHVDAYEITDVQLLTELRHAKEASEKGTQILSSNDFGNRLSAVMMTLLFAVLPFGMLILTVILTIRSKGSYRVIWGATAGFACATLLIYVGFVIQLIVR